MCVSPAGVRGMCVYENVFASVCRCVVATLINPKSGPPTPIKIEVKPHYSKNLGFE
jgi:hypothetical protein